jgi:hypothetical protein
MTYLAHGLRGRRLPLAAAIGILLTLAFSVPASATEPASNYNGNMPENQLTECRNVTDSGTLTAWLVGGAGGGVDSGYRFDGLQWSGNLCGDGQVRINKVPPFRVEIFGTVRNMYEQRGGGGTAPFQNPGGSLTTEGRIRHAEVRGDKIQAPSSILDPSDPSDGIYPNAKSCGSNVTGEVQTAPHSIPGYYKSKSQVEAQYGAGASNSGADWYEYGDPEQLGSKHSGVHYNYELWNWKWTPNTGGGIVRASLPAGATVGICDVSMLTSPMYALDSDTQIGSVRGFYGYFRDDDDIRRFGWFVHSFKRNSDANWTYLVN